MFVQLWGVKLSNFHFLCESPTWLNFTEIIAEVHCSYVWSMAQLWSKLYIKEGFLFWNVLFNASKSFMVWHPEISNQEIHCRLQCYQLMGTMSKEIVCYPVSCFPFLILLFSTSHILWTDLQTLSWSRVRVSDEYVTSCWPFTCIICPQEDFGGMCFINGIFYLLLRIVNALLKGIVLAHLQHSANYKLDLYGSTYFTGEDSVP